MAQAPAIDTLVKALKAMAEPSRLRILRMLATRSLYVCELEAVLRMNQPRVSQHLRVLKEAGLVREAKEAQRIRYSLDQPALEALLAGLRALFSSDLQDLPEFAAEARALESVGSLLSVAKCRGAQPQGSVPQNKGGASIVENPD